MTNYKVRKAAKIRNRYKQAPHLTQDTTWESDKTQFNITNKSQEDIHPQGSDEQTRKRDKHKTKITQMIHIKSSSLERAVKLFY